MRADWLRRVTHRISTFSRIAQGAAIVGQDKWSRQAVATPDARAMRRLPGLLTLWDDHAGTRCVARMNRRGPKRWEVCLTRESRLLRRRLCRCFSRPGACGSMRCRRLCGSRRDHRLGRPRHDAPRCLLRSRFRHAARRRGRSRASTTGVLVSAGSVVHQRLVDDGECSQAWMRERLSGVCARSSRNGIAGHRRRVSCDHRLVHRRVSAGALCVDPRAAATNQLSDGHQMTERPDEHHPT